MNLAPAFSTGWFTVERRTLKADSALGMSESWKVVEASLRGTLQTMTAYERMLHDREGVKVTDRLLISLPASTVIKEQDRVRTGKTVYEVRGVRKEGDHYVVLLEEWR
jgi:head-tail adaptor